MKCPSAHSAYHLLAAELEKHGAGGKEREKNVSRFCTHSNLPFKLVARCPLRPSPYDPIGHLHSIVKDVLPRYLKKAPCSGRLYFTRRACLSTTGTASCLSSSSCSLHSCWFSCSTRLDRVMISIPTTVGCSNSTQVRSTAETELYPLSFSFRSSPCGADSTWYSLGRLLDFHHTCCWLRPCANRRFGAGRRFLQRYRGRRGRN